jgi:hypothetical protein
LLQHGILACYTSCRNQNFQLVYSSLLAPFYPSENSVSVEGEISTPREIKAGVPQGFVLSPTLYNMYINDTPKHQMLSGPHTCMYATVRKGGYILRKLQRGLSSIETWCECWNIKINEDRIGLYFCHRLRPPEAQLTLNGRNIPFVNYLNSWV